MKYFTTFFDSHYLSKGIALIWSLREVECEFKIFILVLDQNTQAFFKKYSNDFPEVELILLTEIEDRFEDLRNAKRSRSLVEYYFTLSPFLPLYLLEKFNLPYICSLDADIMFFSNPSRYFNLLDEFSIVITPHKFTESNLNKNIYGKFNVSFQIFKNNEIAKLFLNKWANLCADWCFDELDSINSRYADQLYLDALEETYRSEISVINDSVGGLAVWNVSDFVLFKVDRRIQVVGGGELVFFHFHNFKFLSKHLAVNGFGEYFVRINKGLKHVYIIYFRRLLEIQKIYCLSNTSGIRYSETGGVLEKLLTQRTFIFYIFHFHFFGSLDNVPHFVKRFLINLNNKL